MEEITYHVNLFQNNPNLKSELLQYCKKRLGLTPGEEVLEEFQDIFGDYDGELSRSEIQYNTENLDSLKEIQAFLRFPTYLEPKHDGTQIVMRVDDRIHMKHKNGTEVDKQDLGLLLGVYARFKGDLLKLMELMREEKVVVKMEIFGREYTPFNVEREPLNFSVFDVLREGRYLEPPEITLPHAVEYMRMRTPQDIDAERVMSWLRSKEGVVIKVFDNGELKEMRGGRNFNMLTFKYKPFTNLLEDEAKKLKLRVDRKMLALAVSEMVTEYVKDRSLTVEEIMDRVVRDHPELQDFMREKREVLTGFWTESEVIKSLLESFNQRA